MSGVSMAQPASGLDNPGQLLHCCLADPKMLYHVIHHSDIKSMVSKSCIEDKSHRCTRHPLETAIALLACISLNPESSEPNLCGFKKLSCGRANFQQVSSFNPVFAQIPGRSAAVIRRQGSRPAQPQVPPAERSLARSALHFTLAPSLSPSRCEQNTSHEIALNGGPSSQVRIQNKTCRLGSQRLQG